MIDDAARSIFAARLTPPAKSALATIAVAGTGAIEVVDRLTECRARKLSSSSESTFGYGWLGETVRDDVVVRVTRTPIETVEIHCHGGTAIVNSLLNDLARAGVAIVDWQTYLKRCGQDEIAVESREAMSRSRTSRCAAILLDQLNGALARAFDKVAGEHDGALARQLLDWLPFGLHLVEPWRIVFFGRANVGKSSLLNAITGYDRAIVTEMPGTTRDVLEAPAALEGWHVMFVDGAGFREGDDQLERKGRTLLEAEIAVADCRVLVVDPSTERTELDRHLEETVRPDLIIGNKSDLPTMWSEGDLNDVDLRCSALTRGGIETVEAAIVTKLVPRVPEPGEAVPFTHRQGRWLKSFLKTTE